MNTNYKKLYSKYKTVGIESILIGDVVTSCSNERSWFEDSSSIIGVINLLNQQSLH